MGESTTGDIATVWLLKEEENSYYIVKNFTVEASTSEGSCLSSNKCCVSQNLTAESQFEVNSSYLYGLEILRRPSDGLSMLQTHNSVGCGAHFNSDEYNPRNGMLGKRTVGNQALKIFQFIIGKFGFAFVHH